MTEYLNHPMVAGFIVICFLAVFYGSLALAINFTKWFR